MKIRTKVKAGRGCGGGSTPDIQSGHTTQRPHHIKATQSGHAGNGASLPQQGDDHEDQDQGQGRPRLQLVEATPVEAAQPGAFRQRCVPSLQGARHEDQDQGQGRPPRLRRRQQATRRHDRLVRCSFGAPRCSTPITRSGAPRCVPFPSQETIMKIKTKVKAGPRDCGGGSGPTPINTDVQSDVHPAHLDASPRSRVNHQRCVPSPARSTIMKIKTKVKAGPRDCGGGGPGPIPISTDVQSDVHPAHRGASPRSRRVNHQRCVPFPSQETIMKIKTKVKAGPRDCGGGGGGSIPKLPVAEV